MQDQIPRLVVLEVERDYAQEVLQELEDQFKQASREGKTAPDETQLNLAKERAQCAQTAKKEANRAVHLLYTEWCVARSGHEVFFNEKQKNVETLNWFSYLTDRLLPEPGSQSSIRTSSIRTKGVCLVHHYTECSEMQGLLML